MQHYRTWGDMVCKINCSFETGKYICIHEWGGTSLILANDCGEERHGTVVFVHEYKLKDMGRHELQTTNIAWRKWMEHRSAPSKTRHACTFQWGIRMWKMRKERGATTAHVWVLIQIGAQKYHIRYGWICFGGDGAPFVSGWDPIRVTRKTLMQSECRGSSLHISYILIFIQLIHTWCYATLQFIMGFK